MAPPERLPEKICPGGNVRSPNHETPQLPRRRDHSACRHPGPGPGTFRWRARQDYHPRAAGQPDQPRSSLDHRRRKPQPCPSDLGNAVRPRRTAKPAAANGRGPSGRGEWPALDHETARGTELSRRHPGPGARLRRVDQTLDATRPDRPDHRRANERTRGGRRSQLRLPPQEALLLPALCPRAHTALAGDHARAPGADRSVQASAGNRRLRPVSLGCRRVCRRQPGRVFKK